MGPPLATCRACQRPLLTASGGRTCLEIVSAREIACPHSNSCAFLPAVTQRGSEIGCQFRLVNGVNRLAQRLVNRTSTLMVTSTGVPLFVPGRKRHFLSASIAF